MTAIILTDAAAKIVKSDVTAFKADGKRYAAYIAEMDVTLETVAEHVAAFRDAFKASNTKATGDEIKAYATKVRNGLNRTLGKGTNTADKVEGITVTYVDADGTSHSIKITRGGDNYDPTLWSNLASLTLAQA